MMLATWEPEVLDNSTFRVPRLSVDANAAFVLTNATVGMLHAYRINCASTTASGQLILPEALKMLPLYAGAIRKFPCFRTGSDFRADEKVATWTRLLSMPLAQSSLIVYPRVFPVLPLPE